MDVGDADLQDRLFARTLDLLVDLPLRALDHLDDSRRMDPSVTDELLQGEPRGLPPDRVEAREHHRLGGVVDDEVDAGVGLEGADVAALTADDPALHVVGRKGEDRDRGFGGLVRRDALDRDRHDLARPLLVLLAGLLLEVSDGRHRVALRFLHDLTDKRFLRLLRRHVRDALETLAVLLRGVFELHPDRGEALRPGVEFSSEALELPRPAFERLLPLRDRSLTPLDLL